MFTFFSQIKFFMNPFDGRYEDLTKQNFTKDLMAGLVVAMVAIPLAMGFAMASGLRPEQGIIGGAVAGLFGALFGGSKYQVYGPTAAYIPIIGALMAAYDHRFLVFASCIAGVLLMLSGVFRLGRVISKVPHSIVVGFTIGIAIVIAFSQMGEIFGFKESLGYGLISQIKKIIANFGSINYWAVFLALVTFIICKLLLRVSTYIPGPLIGLAFGFIACQTFLADKGLVLVKDKFGAIPRNLFQITTPENHFGWTSSVIFDLIYFAVAIYFVAAIESLLCSRMADRLAKNTGTPFHPDKEFWGQGLVNIFTPLLNGFPHTGALARTAVNIRLGAVSPLAGIAKFAFKIILAIFLASYLELVPMACIGGILLYVASGMVKKTEIDEVLHMKDNFHLFLMIFTAVMVPFTDFLTAVVGALVLFVIGRYFIPSTPIAPSDDDAGENQHN
jgi:sulfate permease, SulP family